MSWTIDEIAKLTARPSILNALHACRPGHPWNKTTRTPFRNAAFVASQAPSYVIPSDAIRWLERQADEAGEPTLQEMLKG